MEQVFSNGISWQMYAYNGVLLSVFIYLISYRYAHDQICCYLTCLFFNGMINDFSVMLNNRSLFNLYQVSMLLWGIELASRTRWQNYTFSSKGVSILFLLYGAYFFFCSFFHNDSVLLTLSQFSKLITPICFLLIMKDISNTSDMNKLFWIFWELVTIQMLFSIFKLVLLGGPLEGWVGSITGIRGGGVGTALPLLGLFLFALKSDLRLRRLPELFFIFGLLLIGFATGKRAVWLLFPLLFLILGLYAYRRRGLQKFLIVSALVPFFMYAGLRLVPTLNPENKVGGSFDVDYALKYGLRYSAGIDDTHHSVQSGTGRVGAVKWMWQRISQANHTSLFGSGLEYMVYADYEDYSSKSYYQGIRSRGSITGIVSTFLTMGIVGVCLYLCFIVSLFSENRTRFGVVLMVAILFDYIFYNATMLTTPSLLSLAFFLTVFSKREIVC